MRTVGFCPFCRDAFEGEETCPEHGLVLVPFAALPKPLDAEPGDAWLSLGVSHQRGWLALGAALSLVAFVLPFAHLSGQVVTTNTLLELANHGSKTLWAAVAAGLGQFALLYRRRTPDSLRSARVVAGLFAIAPAGIVGAVTVGTLRAVGAMSLRMGGVEARLGLGFWLIMLAAVPGIWGALRLGTASRRSYRVQLAPD